MNKLIVRSLFVVSSAICCFVFAEYLTRRLIVRAQDTNVAVTPFVFKMDVKYFTKIPTGETVHEEVVARRSDGSTARLEPLAGRPSPEEQQMVRTITRIDGTKILTSDDLGVKVTWPRQSNEKIAATKSALLHPPQNCVFGKRDSGTFQGFGEIAGQRVAIVTRPLGPHGDDPENNWFITISMAPQLGCETLEYLVEEESHVDGSRKTITQAKLVEFALGEPSESFFDIAPGLTEVKPSQFQQKVFSMLGGSASVAELKALAQSDKEYMEGR